MPEVQYPQQEWFATHVRASQYSLQVVKCENEEYCAPTRSSLKTVLPYGFLPAPLCVRNSEGLTVAAVAEEGSSFLSLFQRLAVNLEPAGYKGMNKFQIPYAICCPTVNSYIAIRTCSVCKLYFPSNALVTQHKRQVHSKVKFNEAPRTRPVRIAAKRQRQLMAVIASGWIFL